MPRVRLNAAAQFAREFDGTPFADEVPYLTGPERVAAHCATNGVAGAAHWLVDDLPEVRRDDLAYRPLGMALSGSDLWGSRIGMITLADIEESAWLRPAFQGMPSRVFRRNPDLPVGWILDHAGSDGRAIMRGVPIPRDGLPHLELALDVGIDLVLLLRTAAACLRAGHGRALAAPVALEVRHNGDSRDPVLLHDAARDVQGRVHSAILGVVMPARTEKRP
jgi:hypothetical protein